MNPVQLIQSFIKNESLQNAAVVSLKPGQLVYGKVQKFFPNNTALLQIGNAKLFAQVEAELSTTESHWFEVHSNGDEVQLKVVEGKGQTSSQPSAPSLLQYFQLPETKMNTQLVQFLLGKNLPFTKEQLVNLNSWINKKSDLAKAEAAIEYMIKKDLPFTKQTFQSLLAVQEPQSFSSQLGQLRTYLDDPSIPNLKTVQQLKQMISIIVDNQSSQSLVLANDLFDSSTEIKQMLKNIVQSLGLDYENEVHTSLNDKQKSFESVQSLKPLLMSVMTDLGTSGRDVEMVLYRLTGMQLISHEPNGAMQQIFMQLPISFGESETDVTLQWSGRRKKNGQIDPDYCRILFNLELQSIKQTVIDMQIQNKIVHATVINETKEIETIVNNLKPVLKEKLEGIGYQLSFIKFIPSFEKGNRVNPVMSNIPVSTEFSQGVDIKI
jgi:hypothetical protein